MLERGRPLRRDHGDVANHGGRRIGTVCPGLWRAEGGEEADRQESVRMLPRFMLTLPPLRRYFSSKTYARSAPSMASSVWTLSRREYVAVNFVTVVTMGVASRGVERSLPSAIQTATASRTWRWRGLTCPFVNA